MYSPPDRGESLIAMEVNRESPSSPSPRTELVVHVAPCDMQILSLSLCGTALHCTGQATRGRPGPLSMALGWGTCWSGLGFDLLIFIGEGSSRRKDDNGGMIEGRADDAAENGIVPPCPPFAVFGGCVSGGFLVTIVDCPRQTGHDDDDVGCCRMRMLREDTAGM